MFKRFIFRLVLPVVLLAAAMQSPAVAANNFWVDQASSGSPRAQYNLARMYLWGMKELDIPQNNKEAYKWFLESAEQGFAASQYEVGISLQAGRGVARDAQAAQVWFKKAADQGYANAKPTMSRVAGGRRGSASVLTSTSIPPGEILSLIGGLGVSQLATASQM